ncbi:protein of unknown function DUF29 [Synechococcus sp. PCC 7502]|uniref:DUF29 domain-containing protein n=1 Tax=Synechococcus sp. PCC 7502 TaxID=1173263 RepID=UPI00029FEE68|nr:DUF29 domain-containing protein [Synechococcus sp. PCC 7502]AFY72951.1 protein of unknown function DUF29 [Synechococcus sp. PCC 7502]
MDTLSLRATSQNTLYEQDFSLWLEQTAQLLREGNLGAIDIDSLIEEVESMGRSERQAVKSNLEIILMHLLKYKYQSEKRSNSWRYTLLEHRRRLDEAFKTSPSLKRYFLQEFADCYKGARKLASVETGIAIATFPINTPFTPEQTLDEDYLPED